MRSRELFLSQVLIKSYKANRWITSQSYAQDALDQLPQPTKQSRRGPLIFLCLLISRRYIKLTFTAQLFIIFPFGQASKSKLAFVGI